MPENIDPTPTATTAAATPTPTSAAPALVEASGTVPNTSSEAQTTQGQAAPAEDTFTQVDAQSLPPKERAAYDNMLRDYKKKTAEIADIRRKAEAFDTWQQQQAAAQRQITDEDYNRAFENKESFQQLLQKTAQPIVTELQETRRELVTTKADLFLKDFKQRHKDFDDLDSDGLITGYVQLNPPKTESEWDQRLTEGYKYASKLRSKYEDQGYKRGITRVQEKAASSTELPSGSPTQVYAGGDPTKLTAKEAVELAMRGVTVPRS